MGDKESERTLDSSSLSVSENEIREIYLELAEEISRREERLEDELPIDSSFGIHRCLEEAVMDWKQDRKSVRTIPVCNIYEEILEKPVSRPVKKALTGLDATVNILDDVIDTKELDMESRIHLTVNMAFSSVLTAANLSREHIQEIEEVLRQYFTELFQIPRVENRLLDEMRESSSKQDELEAASSIYRYRARDIKALAEIPGITNELKESTAERVISDLQNYRARRLLFKDIQDVERDLKDGDTTPILYFLNQYTSPKQMAEKIKSIRENFAYSQTGRNQYADILLTLEKKPENLRTNIEHALQTVDREPEI